MVDQQDSKPTNQNITHRASSQDVVYRVDERKSILETIDRANYISSTSQLDELLEKMLNLMIEVAGADSGLLCLLDSGADELVFTVVKESEVAQSLVGARVNKGMGIIGEAVTKNIPLMDYELNKNPRWLHAFNPDLVTRWKSAITIPLALPGKVVGVVQLINFVRADLDLLMVLGGRLAGEIDRMMVIERTTYKNDRLQSLLDVIGRISGTLDQELLMRLVTQQTTKLLKADRTSIFLLKPGTDEVSQHFSFQDPGAPKTVPRNFIKGLLQRAEKESGSSIREIINSTIKDSNTQSGPGIIAPQAVTMPLRSTPLNLGKQASEGERLLGGLMVMNKEKNVFSQEDAQILAILASQTSSFLEVAQLYQDANELFLDVIKSMVTSIDAKDPYTQGHSIRVSDYSIAIAKELDLPEPFIHDLHIGSLLHDVGKIGIPDSILLKPGRLTENEYAIIKSHPTIGKNIMGQVKLLQNSLPAIEQHHEKLNGSGYPLNLRGDEISLMGRIVCVADVFDAMTTDRPYRPGLSHAEALAYLTANADVLFDSDCIEALRQSLEKE